MMRRSSLAACVSMFVINDALMTRKVRDLIPRVLMSPVECGAAAGGELGGAAGAMLYHDELRLILKLTPQLQIY